MASDAVRTSMERLNVARELKAIKKAAHKKQYPLTILTRPATAHHMLEACSYGMRIFHFCGHGQDDGIIFESEKGVASSVNLDTIKHNFARLIAQTGSAPPLAFLGACRSIKSGEILSQAKVPYVVASIQEVPDDLFSTFTERFYEQLLSPGCTVIQAFENARWATHTSGSTYLSDRYFRLLCAGPPPAAMEGRSDPATASSASSSAHIQYLGLLGAADMRRADELLNLKPFDPRFGVNPRCLENGLGRQQPFFVPKMGAGDLQDARAETRLVARTFFSQLQQCMEHLRPQSGVPRCVVLHGSPGVGKTATALLLANHARYRALFPGGVFFVPVGDILGRDCSVDRAQSATLAEDMAREQAGTHGLDPPLAREIDASPPQLYRDEDPVAVSICGEDGLAKGAADELSRRNGAPQLNGVPQLNGAPTVLAATGVGGGHGTSGNKLIQGSASLEQAGCTSVLNGDSDARAPGSPETWRAGLWRRARDCILAGVGTALDDAASDLAFAQKELKTAKLMITHIEAQQHGPGSATGMRPVGGVVDDAPARARVELYQREVKRLKTQSNRYSRRFKAMMRVRNASDIRTCLQTWSDTLLVIDGADKVQVGHIAPGRGPTDASYTGTPSEQVEQADHGTPAAGDRLPALRERAVSAADPSVGRASSPPESRTPGHTPPGHSHPEQMDAGPSMPSAPPSRADQSQLRSDRPDLSKTQSVPVHLITQRQQLEPLEEFVADLLGCRGGGSTVQHSLSAGLETRPHTGVAGGHLGGLGYGLGMGMGTSPDGIFSSSTVPSNASLSDPPSVEVTEPGHVSMLITCCDDSPLTKPDAIQVRSRENVRLSQIQFLGSAAARNTGWLFVSHYYADYNALKSAERLQDFGIDRIPAMLPRRQHKKFLSELLFKQPAFALARGCPRVLVEAMRQIPPPRSIAELETAVERVLPAASIVTWEQRQKECRFMMSTVPACICRGMLRRWVGKDMYAPHVKVWRRSKEMYENGQSSLGGSPARQHLGATMDPSRQLPLACVIEATCEYLKGAIDVFQQRWNVAEVQHEDADDLVKFMRKKGAVNAGQDIVNRDQWCRFMEDWMRPAVDQVLTHVAPLLTLHPSFRYVFKPFLTSDEATNLVWSPGSAWSAVGLAVLRCGSNPGTLAYSYFGRGSSTDKPYLVRRVQYQVHSDGSVEHLQSGRGVNRRFHDLVSMLEEDVRIQYMLRRIGGDTVKVDLEAKANVLRMLREKIKDMGMGTGHSDAGGGFGSLRGAAAAGGGGRW